MKILVIGCGGVGSYFVKGLMECVEQGQIDTFTDITVADGDLVEIDQIRYQNFVMEDVGKNKAEVLAERYLTASIEWRITSERHLGGYDLIVLCVDNEQIRDKVVRFCHKSKKNREFFDLRATGRRIFAMPKTTLEDNLRFVDFNDTESYSCQDRGELNVKGWVQRGNRIVAEIGVQMVLNLIRGVSNRTITITI